MRWTRIALVTAGLAAAGAVFGTLAGMVVLGTWMIVADVGEISLSSLPMFLALSVFCGGGAGAVLGPLAAWLLMRHVPLWLAVGGTTLGTLAGGSLGLMTTGNPVAAMLLGAAGFGLSAVALRLKTPPHQRLTAG